MMEVKEGKGGHGQKGAKGVEFTGWVEPGIEIRETQNPHCPPCKEKQPREQ
jgi:hypothetical protein